MRTESLLAVGLLVLVLAAALSQFVVFGVIGMILMPVAWVALIMAAVAAGSASVDGRPARLASALAGASLLSYAAYRAAELACLLAVHRIHPGAALAPLTAGAWLAALLLATAGGVLLLAAMAVSLAGKRRRWFGAVLAVVPLTAALFWLLAHWLPYTA